MTDISRCKQIKIEFTRFGIRQTSLVKSTGFSNAYISMILNGERTNEEVLRAAEEIIAKHRKRKVKKKFVHLP